MLETASRRGVSVAIVGAGVVGCAIAQALARAGVDVMVLEAEAAVGTQVTSRNSGIVHSGVFGVPGTRKAGSCREGNERLYAWAAAHDVPIRRTGKLIVARDAAGHARLDELEVAAARNEIEVERLDGDAARRAEPALGAAITGALSCPSAGIVDPHALTRSLMVDAERAGAFFALRAAVDRIEPRRDGQTVHTARGTIDAAFLVNAAGLRADEIAGHYGLRRPILPCRGDWFRWRPATAFSRPIYAASTESDAGLGIHTTVELDGSIRVGPDVQWVLDKFDHAPAPHKRAAFAAALSRLVGFDVEPEQLHYDGAGIRPKRHGPREPLADFQVLAHERGVHLLGIESPGLTAALALAREVSGFVRARL